MESIKIYNTLSHSLETFSPITPGQVTIYSCGPTVYDTPHIGNYRTFVMSDIIRRSLEYCGFNVIQVMNITDVDDKTIKRSRDEKVPLSEVTLKYEALFLDGLTALNIQKPQQLIRATEFIPAMIELVEELLKKGVAYKADDGVYMSIDKVKNYGALAHLDLTQAGHERIANDEYDKENARDFALWKFADDVDTWPASFGKGRPGWHIECSAMSMKVLGPTIDIHTGGTDLIFPHHTNEIAQSESATGKKFVNYWVHGGFITISDEKMAKSKGNFIKLEDFEDNSISPLAFRYWLLTAQYRSLVNFSYEAVRGAQNALIKLMNIMSSYPEGGQPNQTCIAYFKTVIGNDFDMPKAIALMWELLKDPAVSPADKRATIIDFDKVFGLKLDSVPRMQEESIPPEIQALADAREEARRSKEWEKSDALRKEIEDRGYTISDTEAGQKIMRI